MNKWERDLLQKDKLIDFFNPLQSHISCSEKLSELPESLEPRSAGKCAFLKPCLTVIALPFRGWWRKNPENSNQESWSDPWEVKHPVGSLTCAFILPPSRSSCAPLAKILLGTRWWKPANNSAYSVFKTLKCPAKGGSWHPSKFTNKKCYCGFYIFIVRPDFCLILIPQLHPAVSFDHIMWSIFIKGAESEQSKISHYI